MKSYVFPIILTFICHFGAVLADGAAVYDLNLKTNENNLSENNNFVDDDLKLQADLSSEYDNDLYNLQMNSELTNDNINGVEAQDEKIEDELLPANFHANQYPSIAERMDIRYPRLEDLKIERECPVVTCPAEDEYSKNFVGTNLFDGNRKKCFSPEDVALLAVRKDFESLIPSKKPQTLMNDDMICVTMQYFYGANKVMQRTNDECAKFIAEKAFFDTLGGYLNYFIVPMAKLSFYAGQANLRTVENVIKLHQQCKVFLNTNGNGWKPPMTDILSKLKNVKIEPLKAKVREEDNDQPSCCIQLDLSSVSNEEDDQMIVALPRLEAEDENGFLGNIWLPFKRKRTFNLRATKSAYIVVRFFETVASCFRFQAMCPDTFNKRFKEWILENIQLHLYDEQFYPGLGAILRVYENLQRGKKSIASETLAKNACASGKDDDEEEEEDDEDDSMLLNDDNSNIDVVAQNENELNDGDAEVDEAAPEGEKKFNDGKQKTQEFINIERQSKLSEGKGVDVLEKMYGNLEINENDDVTCLDDSVSCKLKHMFRFLGSEDGTLQHNLIILGCLLLGIILLILLFCLFLMKRKKRKQCPASCLDRCRKKSSDEEILIQPETTSVLPPKPVKQTSSSTSSPACYPSPKWNPFVRKNRFYRKTALHSSTESIDKPKAKSNNNITLQPDKSQKSNVKSKKSSS